MLSNEIDFTPGKNPITGPDLLNSRSEPVIHGGRIVGHMATLGDRLQFFTILPDMAELDGRIFDTSDALMSAIDASGRRGQPT